ncbi:MAG TPA: spermidine/putrescine ABC transporter substrate-binding protein [Ilumatobacteraceae bacterium]|nr:spermidine/putrescine ABC transporter substrate-binding protein [Ilumatobacteraceae bacterium]HUV17718.1 spermidine/putrescine ABC transporter substrate-binding protein [Ilumatobacteraceae bacterium]
MTTPRSNPFRSPFGRSGLTRRQLLARAGALGAAGVSLPAILAACGSDDDSGSAGSTPATSGGTTGGTTGGGGGGGSLFFENWPAYIDPTEDGLTGTVDRFMEATGIDMRYTEAYNDNVEYFAKIQPLLGRGEPIDPDIIAPTSWLANRLITLGWLEKLPIDQVANAANLRADLQNPSWDPTGEYSLPWQTGFAGIAYNSDVTGREITTVDDLFDPEFAGKVGALTEMRDTIGVIAMSLGIDISTLTTFEEAQPAFDKLQEAKDSGQIRRFHGNDYFDDLSNGNLAITIGWSGDVAAIARDNPAVKFVFPESGATAWADTMVVPKGAKNIDAAAQWMNFVYDPVQAAQITTWVGYVSPVAGVREEVEKLDADLANDPLVFPDDATLASTKGFAPLSEEVEAEYDAAFSGIIGA